MRYIKYLFLLAVAAALVIVAVANRELVELKLFPAELSDYLGAPASFQMPLFMVIFAGVAAGLLIGFVWEWFREHKHRADARAQKREKERLEREMKGLKREANKGKDDVLALLDDAAA